MWFPSVLLVIIAACTAWIAFQQWTIARLKLNHDLFERRYSVYVATQDYMIACLNNIGGDIGDERPFLEARRVSPFLFDANINKFLVEIGRHSATIQVFSKHVNNPELADHQSMMTDYHAAQRWMLKEFEGSAERFYPSLSLSTIKPFPVAEILPVAGIEAIKAKLLRKDGFTGVQHADTASATH